MDTKLTLKLNGHVIEQAKIYAKEKNTSLSKLVESYLTLLMNPDEKNDVTPLVKSLSGIIDFPKNYDPEKDYKVHLLKKYVK